MKAKEIFQHLKEKGTWVNWNRTSDHFLFGDPEMEIKGIAIAWMPTIPNLKKALDMGCNLFITHEPLYIGAPNQYGIFVGGSISDISKIGNEGSALEEDDCWVKKWEWLKKSGLTIMRCHDVWDDFPKIGIHGAWATWLGFNDLPVHQQKFYEIHQIGPVKFGDFTQQILEKVSNIGQETILLIGDKNTVVNRVAIGTGAITDYRIMHQMGADVLILTDDGTRLWESGQWAEDSGIPLIVVNHATAEEPGMRSLGKYLNNQFPSIKICNIERGCLYKMLSSNQ